MLREKCSLEADILQPTDYGDIVEADSRYTVVIIKKSRPQTVG